jgi:hypothetical protein
MSEFRVTNVADVAYYTAASILFCHCGLLAIGFYTSLYIQPYLHVLLAHQPSFGNESSGLGNQEPNLAISLTPQDHVQRQPRTIHLV